MKKWNIVHDTGLSVRSRLSDDAIDCAITFQSNVETQWLEKSLSYKKLS